MSDTQSAQSGRCRDTAAPFVGECVVQSDHIDHMGHVNNADYLAFMEETAWQHTRFLGLTWPDYQAMDVGLVVRHTSLDYLGAAFEDDRLRVATWITGNDHRLKLERDYCIRRASDGKTLLRAHSLFVCVRLSSGCPCRMPRAFIDTYRPVQPTAEWAP